MNEKELVILCLITSLIGIIVMFVANKMIEPKNVKIAEITLNQKYVKINGTISSIFTSRTETTFVKLKDETGIVDVVIFKDTFNITLLNPGMTMEIIGKPQKYKEKIEIIPSIIRLG